MLQVVRGNRLGGEQHQALLFGLSTIVLNNPLDDVIT
jgi:hypothetical protein